MFGNHSLSTLLFWVFNFPWIGCIIRFIFVVIAGYLIRGQADFETILQNGLHVLLGIFCLFVVAIFNKGYILQEDTKLTI